MYDSGNLNNKIGVIHLQILHSFAADETYVVLTDIIIYYFMFHQKICLL